MKLQIIFATGNQNKVREIREILSDPDIAVLSMKEAGVFAEPEENGTTFEENARIKALAVSELVRQRIRQCREAGKAAGEGSAEARKGAGEGSEAAVTSAVFGDKTLDLRIPIVVMSDDSGLVIDALGGMPGIYSARYMGHETSYTLKMRRLLEEMKDVPDEKRTARFEAAVAAVFPEGLDPAANSLECRTVTGTMEGYIAHEIRGTNGFGYDPFFYLPQFHMTSSEISPEQKNAVSHRGKAVRAMMEILKGIANS
ncbi:MAG: non-canonical purine NTP pyrophosphatase [Firmicutes bacterium]|nr:non-canonical purine NTP pyrophosphatase [Bacillota bacterium]